MDSILFMSRFRFKNYIYILLSCFIIFGFFTQAAASRSYNPARYCLSNLKTIEGAVELYLMENSAGVTGVNDLVKNGYLKHENTCRGVKNSYAFEKPINNDNLKDFYKIVKCVNHGFYLEDKNIFDNEELAARKYREERQRFFGAVGAIAFVILLWQIAAFSRIRSQYSAPLKPDGSRAPSRPEERPPQDGGGPASGA